MTTFRPFFNAFFLPSLFYFTFPDPSRMMSFFLIFRTYVLDVIRLVPCLFWIGSCLIYHSKWKDCQRKWPVSVTNNVFLLISTCIILNIWTFHFLEEGEKEVSISLPEKRRGGHGGPAAIWGRGEDGSLHPEDPCPRWSSWGRPARDGQKNGQIWPKNIWNNKGW